MTKLSYLDKFMKEFSFEGLTFDDVTLKTLPSQILPEDSNLETRLTRNITGMPFWSAAMDTVTEYAMAIEMAKLGGIGVIHKNLSIDEQAKQVGKVKHHLHGLIRTPVCFQETDSVEYILTRREEKGYAFHSFPIINNEGKLVGIITKDDFDFCEDNSVQVKEIMTREVETAKIGTDTHDAYKKMKERPRRKVLPLVDENGVVTGMYIWSDVKRILFKSQKGYNVDKNSQLRVAAAIGAKDYARAEALAREGVDVLVVDSAHGGHSDIIKTIKELQHLKKRYDFDIVGGNVAGKECARDLVLAGVDAIKVGVGPGSICTTRVVCGVGIPQITAVYESYQEAKKRNIPVISDGGIRHSGDVPKVLVAGAETVMLGGVLAGTDESPGEKIIHEGRKYVIYRGMGSIGAMRDKQGAGSRERYMQKDTNENDLVPQGIEGIVPYVGNVISVLHQYFGGLRQTMGYVGARTISELKRRGKFLHVSSAGIREAHPHDVKITKEAPNYSGKR